MTTVTILGEAQGVEPKKKIEFVKSIYDNSGPSNNPDYYDNIELVCRDYLDGMDFMLAYMNGNSTRACYLGHFNDGIV